MTWHVTLKRVSTYPLDKNTPETQCAKQKHNIDRTKNISDVSETFRFILGNQYRYQTNELPMSVYLKTLAVLPSVIISKIILHIIESSALKHLYLIRNQIS